MVAERNTLLQTSVNDSVNTPNVFKRNGFIRRIVKIIFRMYFHFVGVEAFGIQNIPKCRSVILSPNSVSPLDMLMIECLTSIPVVIATDDVKVLSQKPMYAHILEHMRYTAKRERGNQGPLKKLLDENKKLLVITPDGHESPDGKLGQPVTGQQYADFGLICYHVRVPVIPVYIEKTGNTFSHLLPKLNHTKTRIYFGKRTFLRDLYYRKEDGETYNRISNRVVKAIEECKMRF